MKIFSLLIKVILIGTIFGTLNTLSLEAFWLFPNNTEKVICRKRAAKEINNFSARKTYEYCIKNIRTELNNKRKEEEESLRRANERKKRIIKKYTIIAQSSRSELGLKITLVPTVSLITKNGDLGVFLVGRDFKPIFKKVEVGKSFGSKTEIISGIKPGNKIFIDIPPIFQ